MVVLEKIEQTEKSDTSVLEGLFGIANLGIEGLREILSDLINLAKTNPLWGAILGIIIVDLSGHKFDPIHWQHTENFCTDCGTLQNLLDWFDGKQHTFVAKTFDGILSQAAVAQISVMIISGFGIAGAGQIIQDIANLKSVIGGSAQASVISPTVTTLVESGNAKELDALLTLLSKKG